MEKPSLSPNSISKTCSLSNPSSSSFYVHADNLPLLREKSNLGNSVSMDDDAQQHNLTFTETHTMKEKPQQFTSLDEADPTVEEERPSAAKKWRIGIKNRFETKQARIVSDDPRKSECRKRKRGIMDDLYDHFEAKSSLVMKRAEEVQASLSPEFPSFVKLMLRSHVTYCFWMGLPSKFCKSHLPGHDETVVLEDESGEEYKTKFLAVSHGLSGGWRGFAKVKKLLEGDAVVFHLVRSCKFKVHIVRANDLAIVDRAPEPVYFDARAEETDFDQSESETDQSENDTENLYSSDMEGYGLSGSIADFNNFNIIVNGLPIDHTLSQHTRTKYYDLCCTQKSYLHNHLLKSVDTKLAAEIVSKTITIADSIRASKLSSTSEDDFAIWDKTLEAFEMLGMDVGFLRARLNRLVRIASELTVAADSKRYNEAKVERDRVEVEMRSLELRLLELKQARSRLDYEMEGLNEKVTRYEVMFQGVANGFW
ncbi:hypothetical protein HYC85_009674 [Camellia sinensis]|uniref:TF-B3 domain-containing protein n=1 Tax=Camellia sinensis TaxID=4442 RepID=A0A7J7HFN4_CAMSI|nr:hypothetical protein HYC85_009674 [Camellia sinensis]